MTLTVPDSSFTLVLWLGDKTHNEYSNGYLMIISLRQCAWYFKYVPRHLNAFARNLEISNQSGLWEACAFAFNIYCAPWGQTRLLLRAWCRIYSEPTRSLKCMRHITLLIKHHLLGSLRWACCRNFQVNALAEWFYTRTDGTRGFTKKYRKLKHGVLSIHWSSCTECIVLCVKDLILCVCFKDFYIKFDSVSNWLY